MPACGSGL